LFKSFIAGKDTKMLQDGQKGVIIQRDKKTFAVAPHIPCGLVQPQTLRKLADVAEKFGAQALKITSACRVAIIGVNESDVDAIWAELGMSPGFAVGLCVQSIKACPGTTFCKRGMQDSLALGLRLDGKYCGMNLPAKFKIGVSGCPNQCAETCTKDIGFVGMPKGWKVLVGGNGGAKPRFAVEIAKDLDTEQVFQLVEKIIAYYKADAKPHQRIGALIEKMGFEQFKTAVISG
jgi:NAD(P)H-nitrite reductase large subunit